MSLYKQLWIAIALLMLVVFGITFVINGASSSRYLEQQLSLKNNDDANALALSLSQDELDPVLLEIQLAAKLDQGSYEYIELKDPSGKVIFSRSYTPSDVETPKWIAKLFPIYSIPGTATVSNGWNPLGDIILKSHDQFAYAELWNGAKRTLIALVLAIVAAGVIGSLLLSVILRPLQQVVGQAQAIGERRFLTLPEPFTTEFAEVTRSMNELARRVREMLSRESQRLTRQREVTELDKTTGILQRDPFMARLRAKLESEEADARGSVALVRLGNLVRLNQNYGRQSIDALLKDLGSSLRRINVIESEYIIGRLNGSDFCIIAPGEDHPKKLGEALQRIMSEVLERHSMTKYATLPGACVDYLSGDSIAHVMTSLDGALLAADEESQSNVVIATRGSGIVVPAREQAKFWREELTSALSENRLLMQTFPVLDAQHNLVHMEGMVRLKVNDSTRGAGEFMPWVHRLDLGGEIDRAMVAMGVENIQQTQQPTCINLTPSSLTDTTFATWLEGYLIKNSAEAKLLSIEVGEAATFSHDDGFRRLALRAHAMGTKVGIEHVGYRISDIGKLGELGVDYIKVDSLFVRDMHTNRGNAALVRTYANIAQSLGLSCIAEGVRDEQELAAVFEAGATGASGPGVAL